MICVILCDMCDNLCRLSFFVTCVILLCGSVTCVTCVTLCDGVVFETSITISNLYGIM